MEEVEKMVESGQYASTDYGWHTGMKDWVPLQEILPRLSELPPPPPPAKRIENDQKATSPKYTKIIVWVVCGILCLWLWWIVLPFAFLVLVIFGIRKTIQAYRVGDAGRKKLIKRTAITVSVVFGVLILTFSIFIFGAMMRGQGRMDQLNQDAQNVLDYARQQQQQQAVQPQQDPSYSGAYANPRDPQRPGQVQAIEKGY